MVVLLLKLLSEFTVFTYCTYWLHIQTMNVYYLEHWLYLLTADTGFINRLHIMTKLNDCPYWSLTNCLLNVPAEYFYWMYLLVVFTNRTCCLFLLAVVADYITTAFIYCIIWLTTFSKCTFWILTDLSDFT